MKRIALLLALTIALLITTLAPGRATAGEPLARAPTPSNESSSRHTGGEARLQASKTLYPTHLAYIESSYATTNHGGLGYMYVGQQYIPIPNTWRGLIRFSTGLLPDQAYITNAEMRASYTCTGDGTIGYVTYDVQGFWTQDAVTWNNQPDRGAGHFYEYLSAGTGTAVWDVTLQVKGWYFGTMVNNGFYIIMQDEMASRSHYCQFSNPHIVVTYDLPTPTATPNLTLGIMTLDDADPIRAGE